VSRNCGARDAFVFKMLRRSFEPEHDLGSILGNLSELELEHAAGRFHDRPGISQSSYFGKVPSLDLHLHKNTSVLILQHHFMKDVTPSDIRQFLLVKYSGTIEALGLTPADLPDDFDLLLSGVIDSFGILEMISTIEEEFQVELDLAALDAEQITIVGPLSRFVASNAKTR